MTHCLINKPAHLRSILFLIIFTLVSCSDRSNVGTASTGTTPPVAAFSINVSTGVAPASIEFTDLSTAGSSVINAWAWDFGDGGTSDLQNPQYIFQTAGSYNISLTVTTADGSDSTTIPAGVAVREAESILKLTLLDETGLPLEGVVATSEQFTINLQQYTDLNQLELILASSASDGVVHLSKQGYIDGILFLQGLTNQSNHQVTLMKRHQPVLFDAEMGGRFTGVDGASLQIFPNTLVHADGSFVVGEVELYITPIDIQDDIQRSGFPGSFYGIRETALPEEPAELIASYGVVEMSLFQQGEELQLGDGMNARIELPLYPSKHSNGTDIEIGQNIPLWTLNETSGIWEQQGWGLVVENLVSPTGMSLSGTTTHFTWFNADYFLISNGDGTSNDPCTLNMTIGGADIGELYTRKVAQSEPGLSTWGASRAFTFTNIVETEVIPQEVNIDVLISGGRRLEDGSIRSVSAKQSVRCNENQDSVNVVFNLEPTELFVELFGVISRPVFEKNNIEDQYTINKNLVNVRAIILGADESVITSPIIEQPFRLPNFMRLEVDYLPTDPSTTTFTMTVTAGEDQLETTQAVQYVSAAAPIVSSAYAYHPNETETVIVWSATGVDSLVALTIAEEPGDEQEFIFEDVLNDSIGRLTTSIFGNFDGYLDLGFQNQYGVTIIRVRLQPNDPSGSE